MSGRPVLTVLNIMAAASDPPHGVHVPLQDLARNTAFQLRNPGRKIENELLDALPRRSYAQLLPLLEGVDLSFGDTIHQQGGAVRHVYFPGGALISLLAVAEGHPALEVGLIGREGMVGISVALGAGESTLAALVQGSGSAVRVSLQSFRRELAQNPPLQRLLLRFSAVLMGQVSQTAACNRFHVVEQRLARWLLMSSDRLRLEEFRMTHEFLALMLGVRRVGVTEAAHELQKRHLIAYHRGVITIVDRAGLETSACRCYAAVRTLYERARLGRTERRTGGNGSGG